MFQTIDWSKLSNAGNIEGSRGKRHDTNQSTENSRRFGAVARDDRMFASLRGAKADPLALFGGLRTTVQPFMTKHIKPSYQNNKVNN